MSGKVSCVELAGEWLAVRAFRVAQLLASEYDGLVGECLTMLVSALFASYQTPKTGHRPQIRPQTC
jgi:hypothetical protein